MTLKNTLQNYFNSGSPEKRAKRRIGGLVIAVTAIALAAAMIVLVVSAFASIGNGKDKGNADSDGGGAVASVETREANIDEINAILANKKVGLDDNHLGALSESDYVVLNTNNRPKNMVDKNGVTIQIYGTFNQNLSALQTEAHAAFNAMTTAFYLSEGKCLMVTDSYSTGKSNTGFYASALAVQLNSATVLYTEDGAYKGLEEGASIWDDPDYGWIYDNAHEYGFVRVSDAEGEENIFRYVGVAHAKYMEDKSSDDDVMTLAEYLEDVKMNTSAESPRRISKVENAIVEGTKKADYYVYFVYHGDTYKLPNPDKYSFTVDNVGNGFIITCTAK